MYLVQDAIAPLPLEEGRVVGGVVLCQVLVFLSVLLQDLSKLMQRRRLSSLDPSLISVSLCMRCVLVCREECMPCCVCRSLILLWIDSLWRRFGTSTFL